MATPVLLDKQLPETRPMAGASDPVLGGAYDPVYMGEHLNSASNTAFASEVRRLAKAHIRLNKNAQTITQVGDSHLLRGEVGAARSAYASAIRHDPKYLPAYGKLINANVLLGEIPKADSAYAKMVALTNNDETMVHDYALFKMAFHPFISPTAADEAGDMLGSLLNADPDNAIFLNSYGVYEITIHQDYGQAAGFFEAALGRDDRFVHALNNLGVCLMEGGQWSSAIDLFATAQSIDAKYPAAYENLANAYIKEAENSDSKTAKFRAALDVLSEAITTGVPISVIWVHKVGWLYIQMEMWQKAIDWYTSRIELEPENDLLLNNLAYCFQRIGRLDIAKDYYQQSVDQARKNFKYDRRNKTVTYDLRSLLQFSNLARIAIDERNYELLDEMYQEILRLNPNSPEGHFFKGVASFNRKKYKTAKESYRAAISLGLTSSIVQAFTGLSFILEEIDQDYEQTVSVLEDAISRGLDHPMIKNNLAYALLKMNRIEEAEDVLSDGDMSHPYLRATRGLLAFAKGNMDEGNKLYESAIQELPEDQKEYATRKWRYEEAYYNMKRKAYKEALEQLVDVAGQKSDPLEEDIVKLRNEAKSHIKSAR